MWPDLELGVGRQKHFWKAITMWYQCKNREWVWSLDVKKAISGYIDAMNLIVGNENQLLEPTIRGQGQNNCFQLKNKEKFCI